MWIAIQLLSVTLWAVQQPDLPASVASLVQAERWFARTSVERGVRAAFLAFFADDGINFTPRPTRTKEYFNKLTDRGTATLDWQPVLAEVSAAGDLGYTTGPYQRTDASKPGAAGHGYFFSVWKVQSDGTWKVVLDAGIRTPGRQSNDGSPTFRALPKRSGSDDLREDTQRALLLAKESSFGTHGSRGDADDFVRLLDAGARLHRNGEYPIVGATRIRNFLAARLLALKWKPIHLEVARSGDLAYSYGSCEMNVTGPSKGYYAHIWHRSESADWKLVLDTLIELPPEP